MRIRVGRAACIDRSRMTTWVSDAADGNSSSLGRRMLLLPNKRWWSRSRSSMRIRARGCRVYIASISIVRIVVRGSTWKICI